MSGRPNRAVFLDRDGVLNEPVVRNGKPFPPADASELIVSNGAFSALSELRDRGFLLVCVTNQPDIARGTLSRDTVDAIHARLLAALPLERILVCPHDDVDGCRCRKPKPGLIEEAARDLAIDAGRSYLVGDRWRDIDAGAAAGCRTVLIDRGYDERSSDHTPDMTVATIEAAAQWILTDAREAG